VPPFLQRLPLWQFACLHVVQGCLLRWDRRGGFGVTYGPLCRFVDVVGAATTFADGCPSVTAKGRWDIASEIWTVTFGGWLSVELIPKRARPAPQTVGCKSREQVVRIRRGANQQFPVSRLKNG